jgi:hypothetical protein
MFEKRILFFGVGGKVSPRPLQGSESRRSALLMSRSRLVSFPVPFVLVLDATLPQEPNECPC